MNPVDQIRTKTTGIANRSIPASIAAAAGITGAPCQRRLQSFELDFSNSEAERARLAANATANGARLSLSGRNLKWWTNFRGGDPEAQNFGAGGVPDAIQRNRELAAYPASKSYWLTLNVDF